MARNTPYEPNGEAANKRREFLRKTTTLALGACAVAATPLAWAAASTKPGLPPQAASMVRVVRWDAARHLSDLSHLRAGWLPPCASLIGLPYPVSLAESVSAVPQVTSFEAPRPVRLKLLGYDGRAGIAALHLDALFVTGVRNDSVAYGWADVTDDRQISVASELNAWAIGGSVELRLTTSALPGSRTGGIVPIQLPSAAGVYLALISPSMTPQAISDLRFSEQIGGGYHRRLTSGSGQPLDQLGYFLFVVESA